MLSLADFITEQCEHLPEPIEKSAGDIFQCRYILDNQTPPGPTMSKHDFL
jgi:hypothetical protein